MALFGFNALSADIIAMVVDKFIVELQAQLDDKGGIARGKSRSSPMVK